MRYAIISGNPKTDGLCYGVMQSVQNGANDGGAEVINVNILGVGRCKVCGNGWGTCRNENRCAFGDDGFDEAQKIIASSDAVCFITPVYWGETAEGLKCFMDRFRRCELRSDRTLAGKSVLLIASAGGSGNGIVTCLDQMGRFCIHIGANVFDYIGVNRWNSDYKKEAAYKAAKVMAQGRKNGDTL